MPSLHSEKVWMYLSLTSQHSGLSTTPEIRHLPENSQCSFLRLTYYPLHLIAMEYDGWRVAKQRGFCPIVKQGSRLETRLCSFLGQQLCSHWTTHPLATYLPPCPTGLPLSAAQGTMPINAWSGGVVIRDRLKNPLGKMASNWVFDFLGQCPNHLATRTKPEAHLLLPWR